MINTYERDGETFRCRAHGEGVVKWIDADNVIFERKWYRLIDTHEASGRITIARFAFWEDGSVSMPRSFLTRMSDRLYNHCKACREKQSAERWAKHYDEHAVPWDGQTMLCSNATGDYFDDVDALVSYLDFDDDDPSTFAWARDQVDGLRLVLCEPDFGRTFEMADFQSDHLPEDHRFDFSEIDLIVANWLKAKGPLSYKASNTPVTDESVWEALGIMLS